MAIVRLIRPADQRLIASIYYQAGCFQRWHAISDWVAADFECRLEEVGCIETDDGDAITVRDEVVALVEEPTLAEKTFQENHYVSRAS